MSTVKFNSDFVDLVRAHATAKKRSIPKQIEYWARLGKIAEENSEMTGQMILECLAGLQEVRDGKTSPYVLLNFR